MEGGIWELARVFAVSPEPRSKEDREVEAVIAEVREDMDCRLLRFGCGITAGAAGTWWDKTGLAIGLYVLLDPFELFREWS